MAAVSEEQYCTQGGIVVYRSAELLMLDGAVEPIIDALDTRRGVLLASSYEYPGRYTRWDMGFVDPPLEMMSRDREFQITALNTRGAVLIPKLVETLEALDAIESLTPASNRIAGVIRKSSERFPEELRSRQPSVFSLLRAVRDLFLVRKMRTSDCMAPLPMTSRCSSSLCACTLSVRMTSAISYSICLTT